MGEYYYFILYVFYALGLASTYAYAVMRVCYSQHVNHICENLKTIT